MKQAASSHEKLGDGPIEPKHHAMMNALANALDETFNGDARGPDRKTGFVLLVFPFGNVDGRANYISNAERSDIVVLLKEQLARFEGQAEAPFTAADTILAALRASTGMAEREALGSIVEIANYGAKKLGEIDPGNVTPNIAGSNRNAIERFWLIARTAKAALSPQPGEG